MRLLGEREKKKSEHDWMEVRGLERCGLYFVLNLGYL